MEKEDCKRQFVATYKMWGVLPSKEVLVSEKNILLNLGNILLWRNCFLLAYAPGKDEDMEDITGSLQQGIIKRRFGWFFFYYVCLPIQIDTDFSVE